MAHWAEIAVKFMLGIFSNQNTGEMEMPLLGQCKIKCKSSPSDLPVANRLLSRYFASQTVAFHRAMSHNTTHFSLIIEV